MSVQGTKNNFITISFRFGQLKSLQQEYYLYLLAYLSHPVGVKRSQNP